MLKLIKLVTCVLLDHDHPKNMIFKKTGNIISLI